MPRKISFPFGPPRRTDSHDRSRTARITVKVGFGATARFVVGTTGATWGTLTPLPPTPTPVPRVPLSIRAELDPPTPRAGEEFVVALSITNDGERPARGIYVATTGPWDRWTVLDVQPSGTFARDATGWHIVSPIEIAPNETRTLELHVRADEATEEQLTFAVREAEPDELP